MGADSSYSQLSEENNSIILSKSQGHQIWGGHFEEAFITVKFILLEGLLCCGGTSCCEQPGNPRDNAVCILW